MARYGHTKLSSIAKLVFPEIDNCLLEHLKEGVQILEPKWYLPVIPLILVNGCTGLGTGWRSNIPCFNPRDIIDRLRCLLTFEKEKKAKGVKEEIMEVELLCPWYRGFKGSILHSGNDVRGHRIYTSSGVVKLVKPTTLVITELPIGLWTLVYKEETLEQMLAKGLIKTGVALTM
ncbi:unnamed protein product [Cuscuta campestris]|uniref:DNA topoisomerase (ATP-hydrolyzing) n=1 Tax=Cuscuta campestris TaxID=132261 RepID=A0A484KJL3_9ASTE|nr:unnamed protein product [Cuscuta campestris]